MNVIFRTCLALTFFFIGWVPQSLLAQESSTSKPLIAIKTQLPEAVDGVIYGLGGRGLSVFPPFHTLEVEVPLGHGGSIMAYAGLRRYYTEYYVPGWGTPFYRARGLKLGAGYRQYLKRGALCEGWYLQPVVQFWKGTANSSTGDTFANSEKMGGSLVLHGGYQIFLWKGLLLDGAAGLGVGMEDSGGTMGDRISGMHYMRSTSAFGIAGDLRLGIGWMF